MAQIHSFKRPYKKLPRFHRPLLKDLQSKGMQWKA